MAPRSTVSASYKVAFLALAVFAFLASATVTKAGFEWVPEKNAPAPAQPQSAPQAAPVTPVLQAPPAQQPQAEPALPMPGEDVPAPKPVAETPAAAPKPAQAAPAAPAPVPAADMAPLLPQPLAESTDMETPEPAESALAPMPPVIQAPQERSKIKVLEITPEQDTASQQQAVTPAADSADATPLPVPETTAEDGLAPPPPAMKVIMPEDAPDSAMESTPNSEKLTIAPYPQQPETQAPETAAQAEPQPEPAAAPQTSEFAVVSGFGKDIPLVIALREIVPTEYAFSFSPDLNLGQRVSWEGDKPWNEVVDEIVGPLNLKAEIQGKVVHIGHAGVAGSGRQSAAEIPDEPAAAQTQTALSDGEAVPLVEIPERSNVTDPGPAPQGQPAQTIERLQEISAAQPPQDLTKVEPAAGDATAEIDAAAPPAADAGQDKLWEARKGESLKSVIDQWSSRAGVDMSWQASHDYNVNVDISTDSSFEDAVRMLMANAASSDEKPQARFLKDAESDALSTIVIKDAAPQSAL